VIQQHPITPPPELAAKWVAEIYDHPAVPLHSITLQLVERAAQWGADAELEACCEWVDWKWSGIKSRELRAARRPKPPSLKEEALKALDHILNNSSTDLGGNTIRRALEQLPDYE